MGEPSPGPVLGELMALGRTAEIYPWGEGRVLKLFFEWYPRAGVAYEARIARTIHAAGLPVPAVGSVVEVTGRLGLEYERVEGVTMLQQMIAKPWRLPGLARLLAELHTGIHIRVGMDGLPSVEERLEQRIRQAEGLGARQRQAALTVLERLPSGNRLCHGDFHPQNVILSARGPVVIDWIDAMVGNPWADVARTILLLEEASAIDGSLSRVQRWIAAWFCRAYERQYLHLRGGVGCAYRAWRAVVAAVRLGEQIEGTEGWLRQQVDRGLTEASDG